uniref:Putative lysis protection protein n=1 Tax=viral metagenome TaxID=1070528 RepID=A0A6M3JHC1_9ZZZZ
MKQFKRLLGFVVISTLLTFNLALAGEEKPKMKPATSIEVIDYKLKYLELQVQLESAKAKLQNATELVKLYEFYISEMQKQREVAQVGASSAMKELEKYKNQLDASEEKKK